MKLKNGINNPDKWQHRSKTMCCETCLWFLPKLKINAETEKDYNVGRCRRHAPTTNGYPIVFVSDWCGDHKLNENKV